jgi:thioredoxin 1
MLEITDQKVYEKLIKDNKIVFIDFYAQWCGPCKRISPYIEELSEIFDNVKFIKIDVEQMEELSISFKIEAMPTFVILKNGKEETRIVGCDKDKLKKMLKEY